MTTLVLTAQRLQRLCCEAGWPFCFIGGLAVQRWGEMRFTKDVDATIYTGFGKEDPVIDRLTDHYSARTQDPKHFARVNRVLLIQDPQQMIGIDISMGALDFEWRLIERATTFAFTPDIELLTCSAEDLIVLKAFADRELDWHDVKGVLIRQQGTLDFDLIRRELTPLAEIKEQPEILDRLEQLFERYP